MNFMKRLNFAITFLERTLMLVAALMLLSIMLISTLDVLMRYVFNQPLGWAYDLISLYLMCGLFFFVTELLGGVPSPEQHGEND